MSEEFSVDLDQLDGLVTHLSNLVGLLSERLDDLDQRSAAVHAGSWAGTPLPRMRRRIANGPLGHGSSATASLLWVWRSAEPTIITVLRRLPMARCCAGTEVWPTVGPQRRCDSA